MLLQITQKLVDTYKNKFLQGNITEEELTELYQPTHFKPSKKQKIVPTERASDEYYDRIDALLDFVTTIGAKMSEYQLRELNKKLVLIEAIHARKPESAGFMRDMTLAKYFVAYAAWRFPENEKLIFDSPEIQSVLTAPMASVTYAELHRDFMQLMWPAKISLMIHITEDKAAQLNRSKIDSAINYAKTNKLVEGYKSLKKDGHMEELQTSLQELINVLDKRISKLHSSKAEEKLLRPVAADGSDSIGPSPSPSPSSSLSSSLSFFWNGCFRRVTPSDASSNSMEGLSSVDLDKEVASVTGATAELVVENFNESNTESARASV